MSSIPWLSILILTSIVIGLVLGCVAIFRYLEPRPDWQFSTLEERLKEQVKLQWRWATVYGVLNVTLTLLAWASAAGLLGLSTYYARASSETPSDASLWISILTSLSVGIPLLLSTLDIRTQQKTFTRAALAFDAMWCRLHYAHATGAELEALKAEVVQDYIRFRATISEHLTTDPNEASKAPEPTTTSVTPPATQEARRP